MAMAAGKSAGKPLRMTDKAFKPPADAAMAMTGQENFAVETRGTGRAAAGVFVRRLSMDLRFMHS